MEQKIRATAATVIAMMILFITPLVITNAAHASEIIKTNTFSEEITQSRNIQNKTDKKELIDDNNYLSLMSAGIYTLQTNLEDGFTMRASKKTFDVWAKKNGMKMPASATLFRINSNGDLKNVQEISIGWDDGNKVSFILDMGNQSGGDFLIKVWTGGDNMDSAAVVREYHFTYEKTPPGGYIGDIVIDIEAFTVCLGYIEEPVRIPVYEGENAAKAVDRFLKENGYEYDKTGSLDSGFYLGRIRNINSIDLSSAALEQKVSTVVSEDDWNPDDYTEGSLGEQDFTGDSGWMYSVNNVFPNVGLSDYYLEEGDVLRIQFTVARGREIGASGSTGGAYSDYYAVADKSELTSLLADINSAINSQMIKDDQTAARLIANAIQVNETIAIEQDQVDETFDLLQAYLGKNSESPTISLNVSEIILRKGNSQKIEVSVSDISTLYPMYIQWETEDALIATVDSQGTVLAQRSGKTNVIVSVGQSRTRCKVTVEEVPLEGIRLVPVTLFSDGVDPYEQYKTENGYRFPTSNLPEFMIEPVPEDTTDDITPQYSINTRKYMSFSVTQDYLNRCTAIGKHSGTTILTAKVGEFSDQIEIEFYEKKVEDFTCEDPEPVLSLNGYNAVNSKVLKFTVDPVDAIDRSDVFFSTSDPDVFAVADPPEQSDGNNISKRIYARGEGVAELYVTIGNVTKTIPVTVYDLKESDEIVPYGYDKFSQVYDSSGAGSQTDDIGGVRYRAGKEYKGTKDADRFSIHLDDPSEILSFQGTTYKTHDFVCAGWGMDIYAKTYIWPHPELTGSSGTATFTNNMFGKSRMVTKVTVADKIVPVQSIGILSEGNAVGETGVYNVGDEKDLSCLVTPADATGEVVWYSSDISVATVDQDGHLEIKGYGDADIVACIAGRPAIHKVQVYKHMTGMTISNQTLNITTGTSRQLMAWCVPNDTTDDHNIIWESSDPETVSVSANGKINALRETNEGAVQITAKAGGFSVTCEVTVDDHKLRQIYFPASPVYVETGEVVDLGAPMTIPASASADADEYEWSSSDASFASVDQTGNVTLHKASPVDRAGTRVTRSDYYYNRIKIYAERDGVKGTCVIETGSPMTGMDMSSREVTLYKGDEIELEALFLPDDTTEDRSGITWTSSNNLVASHREIGENFTAFKRYVVGNKPGEAMITAYCGEFSATCKVKVVLPPAQQAAHDLQKKIEEWAELDPVSDRAEYVRIGKEIMDTWESFTDAQKDLVGGYNEYFAEHAEEIRDMAEDDDAAAGAADLIKSIGEVSFDKSCKSRIDAARNAYDALTDAQKNLISADVLKVLTDAEQRYGELKKADEKKQEIARKKAAAGKLTVSKLKVKSKSRKFTISWKKNHKATGYQVQYRKKDAKKFTNLKKAVVKVKVKSKKLKKGKKYQFRVRTYTIVEGSKVYGKWTKVRTVKCK